MKRRLARSVLTVFVAFVSTLLTGCTSVKIQSARDSSSVQKLNRLFVIVRQGEVGKTKLSDEFIGHFFAQFTNSPVKVDFSIVTPLDLDEKAHLEKAKAFQPDAILVVSAVSGILDQYGGYPTIIYDASLYDPEMKKRLWRGNINNSGGTALMNRRMREMAENIVAQLRKDGFL